MKGNNIVIDDDNHLPITRKSYISSLQEKNDFKVIVKVIAICFDPIGEMLQCLWANEWALASRAAFNEKNSSFNSNFNSNSSSSSLSFANYKVKDLPDIEEWFLSGFFFFFF